MNTLVATQLPTYPCPVCGEQLNAATSVRLDGTRPESGDLTVCAYCASFLTFTESMGLREMTLEEIGALDDDILIILQRARRVVIDLRGPYFGRHQ